MKNDFIKPFTGNMDKMEEKGTQIDSKTSCFTMATTKHETKVKIVCCF